MNKGGQVAVTHPKALKRLVIMELRVNSWHLVILVNHPKQLPTFHHGPCFLKFSLLESNIQSNLTLDFILQRNE